MYEIFNLIFFFYFQKLTSFIYYNLIRWRTFIHFKADKKHVFICDPVFAAFLLFLYLLPVHFKIKILVVDYFNNSNSNMLNILLSYKSGIKGGKF